MPAPVQLVIDQIQYYLRNVTLRLPFRYGNACLVAAPLLHTRLQARSADGHHATGVAADMLPPKWFDKSPSRGFRDNINDLMSAARIGRQHYLQAAENPANVFEIWHAAYPQVQYAARMAGLNGLTASFGSSIVERAVIDAACKLAHLDFFSMVKENRLGIQAERVHPELESLDWQNAWPEKPLDDVYVRHTIGLADPLREADLTAESRLDDGLPQTLEAWIREAGVRYFKAKLQGSTVRDLERLRNISAVIEACGLDEFHLTLDGNEQFHTAEELSAWLQVIGRDPIWHRLRPHLLFIEQPLERTVALTGPLGGLGETPWPPIIIDESDDQLDALKQAVAQGYRGTSVKNCKGVLQALLNKLLVDHYRAQGKDCLLTSEDLCNQPLIPLQQDLCTLSVLGVEHAERNGHHYVGTLEHIPEGELQAAVAQHPDLFLPHGKSARLRIHGGKVSLRTLRQPGYGTTVEPSWSSMAPEDEWQFESLGIEE